MIVQVVQEKTTDLDKIDWINRASEQVIANYRAHKNEAKRSKCEIYQGNASICKANLRNRHNLQKATATGCILLFDAKNAIWYNAQSA